MKQALRSTSKGFVLVGVVIFILALTILGLSLFSLSSYEGQFLGNSLDELQAFHVAGGAIERAKLVLAARGRLELVQQGLPPHVDSTMAAQEQLGLLATSGDVDWSSGAPIFIRARATYGGSTRTMHAWFTPHQGEDLYRRLITVQDSLSIPAYGGDIPQNLPAFPRRPQAFLSGAAWVGPNTDTTWSYLGPVGARPKPITARATGLPDIGAYIQGHPAGPPPAIQNGVINLAPAWVPGSPPTYYKSTASGSSEYSLRLGSETRLMVRGTVVWMFDRGFRSDGFVKVDGSGSAEDCLILVAKQGRQPDPAHPGAFYPYGLWFFGSIWSDAVPVILVSDAAVAIEHAGQMVYEHSRVNYLSIYAKSAWIMGPVSADKSLFLNHPTTEPDAVIDRLNGLNILPGQGDVRNRFSLVQGTWSEDNPLP